MTHRISFLCCFGLLGLSITVAAQDLLEPLVVTAVASPDGAGAAELAALATLSGDGGLPGILVSEPNVQVAGAPGSAFSLRGVSLEGVPTVGTRANPPITVMSGGMPRSTNTLWVLGAPVWDMGELEVVRGPVLFGSGPVSQGGEIRLEPNAPEFSNGGRLLGEVGEFGYFRSGITGNFVLVPDVLALRLNFADERSDGAVTNVTLDDDKFNAMNRQLLRGQLRWRPAADERSVVDFLVESEWGGGNPLGFSTTLPGGDFFDRKVALNTREKVISDRQAASLRAEVELEPGRRVEGEMAWQQIGGYQIGDLDRSPFLDWRHRVTLDERRLTGGARLHAEDGALNWTLGLYAESSDYQAGFSGVGLAPVPQGSPFDSGVDESVGIAAVFAKAEYQVAPELWIVGGLRLDHQERKQVSQSTVAGFSSGSNRVKTRSTEWLPELGVEFRGEDAKAGVKVSRSYRPAGAAWAALLGTGEAYSEERGWEVNGFAERQWAAFRAGARIFYAKLDDQQVPYAAAGGLPIFDEFIANAGKSTRAGTEVEITWAGPGAFSVGLAGGWLFTRYDELTIGGLDRSGQKFPDAPEWTASAHLAWSPAVGWFGETLLMWSDTTYSQVEAPQATALESRLLLSARAGYRWKNGEIYLFGTNLLNDDFALFRKDFSAIGGGVDGLANMPRMFGCGFSVHW